MVYFNYRRRLELLVLFFLVLFAFAAIGSEWIGWVNIAMRLFEILVTWKLAAMLREGSPYATMLCEGSLNAASKSQRVCLVPRHCWRSDALWR